MLLAAGEISRWKNIKQHFRFTYINFGAHILFIATLAGMFHFHHWYLLWFFLLLGIAGFFYWQSLHERSFYFLVVLTLYSYIGFAYVIGDSVVGSHFRDMTFVYLALILYIASAIGMIRFLIHHNKKFKAHDRV